MKYLCFPWHDYESKEWSGQTYHLSTGTGSGYLPCGSLVRSPLLLRQGALPMHGGKNPRWLHKRSLERRILGAAYGRGNHHVRGTPRAEKTQRQRDDDAVNRPHNDHCAGGFPKAQPALTSSGIARRIPSWCAAEPGLLRWRLGQETRFFCPRPEKSTLPGLARQARGLWYMPSFLGALGSAGPHPPWRAAQPPPGSRPLQWHRGQGLSAPL